MRIDTSRFRKHEADAMALQLAAGRVGIAGAMMASPVLSARLLGADTATAQRVTWLTRMMAVRDGALGAGGVAAWRRGGDTAPWLIGGAVSDAVDALVIAGALKQGRVRGPVPAGIVVGAIGAAALGIVTALRVRRHP